jgi:hypothetical protein
MMVWAIYVGCNGMNERRTLEYGRTIGIRIQLLFSFVRGRVHSIEVKYSQYRTSTVKLTI